MREGSARGSVREAGYHLSGGEVALIGSQDEERGCGFQTLFAVQLIVHTLFTLIC